MVQPVQLTKPITIVRGATFMQPLRLANPDGTALDLEGRTFAFEVPVLVGAPCDDPLVDDTTLFIDLTTENGGISLDEQVIDGVTYNVTLNIGATETSALDPLENGGNFQFKMITDSGDPGVEDTVDVLFYGKLNIPCW